MVQVTRKVGNPSSKVSSNFEASNESGCGFFGTTCIVMLAEGSNLKFWKILKIIKMIEYSLTLRRRVFVMTVWQYDITYEHNGTIGMSVEWYNGVWCRTGSGRFEIAWVQFPAFVVNVLLSWVDKTRSYTRRSRYNTSR